MTAKEYGALRLDLKKAGFQCSLVRNRLFKAAIRDAGLEKSVDSPYSRLSSSDSERLQNMFVGPTCVATMNLPQSEMDSVKMMEKFVSIMATRTSGLAGVSAKKIPRDPSKFLILGARMDGMVLSQDQMSRVRKEFPLGVSGIHAQLLGILEASQREMLGLLQAPGQSLVMNLEQLGKQKAESE